MSASAAGTARKTFSPAPSATLQAQENYRGPLPLKYRGNGLSVLIPAEILIAERQLAGAWPRLVAVAGIVHDKDLRRVCRDELARS